MEYLPHYLPVGIGLFVVVLGLGIRCARLERRIERLEKYTHRHSSNAYVRQFGPPGHFIQPPENCDHGYKDWDECPTCRH